MGLGDLLGIADLHCRKVEGTKWLKHKLMADLGFLFLLGLLEFVTQVFRIL